MAKRASFFRIDAEASDEEAAKGLFGFDLRLVHAFKND